MPKHTIEYEEYAGPQVLSQEDRALLEAAGEALEHSYSPYSNFKVGAAVRLAGGEIVLGWNTENAAYPMCLCAEPAALAAAASRRPGEAILGLAVTVRAPGRVLDRPASPCGSCRQQLAEAEFRQGQAIRLILRGQAGPVHIFQNVSSLLPFGFSGDLL